MLGEAPYLNGKIPGGCLGVVGTHIELARQSAVTYLAAIRNITDLASIESATAIKWTKHCPTLEDVNSSE